VIEALDRRLRALEAWRAPLPLWGGHAPRARSDARLQDLVGTLAALANRCELAPLLGAPRALRKLGAGFRAVAPSANRRGWTLAVSVRGETHELRLDVDPTELCRALDGASATVSEAELRNAIPDASLSGLHALVAKLVKLGALEIAAPAGDGAG